MEHQARRWPKVLAVLVLCAFVFVIYWPTRWWNFAVFSVERTGGRVTFLRRPDLEGRSAVILPESTTDEDVAAMKELDRLQPVWLQLPNCAVTNDGVASLVRLQDLRGLSLLGTRVDDEGLTQLQALPYLEALLLDSCPISDKGLERLEQLSTLRTLSVRGTNISMAGVEHLQAALPSLRIYSAFTPDDD